MVLFGLGLALGACNDADQFEEEQYEKIVYALSYSDYAFPISIKMTGAPVAGFVTAGLSGTIPDNEDITVTFEKDNDALLRYNILNFDLDSTKYAKELAPSHFSIKDYTAVIKAGNPIGTMKISIIPEGLSPDSIYMIPLKIKSVSKYKINEELQTVLYRVMLENEYASQEEQTSYFMKGREIKDDGSETMIAAGKRVFPISKNQIRTTHYTRPYQNNANYLRTNSMIITIADDMTLTLEPTDKQVMQIEQIGGAKENYYGPDLTGTNRFNLHYKFRTRPYNITEGTYGEWGKWKNIVETLKRQ